MGHQLACLVAAAGLLCGAVSTSAHHSLASMYREHERVTIEGVVVTLVYRNPHSYVHVQAPDAHQHLRVWAVESSMGHQLRDALGGGMLKPGDHVIVTGQPAHDDGAWRVRLQTLVRARDGWRWTEGGR